MKKGFAGLLLFLFMILLVGCSRETINCSKTSDEDGIKTTEELTAIFENQKIIDFKTEVEMEFSSEEEANLYNSYLDSTKETYELMGMTYESEINGRKLIITIVGDMEDILEEYDETTNTPESFKEMMDEEGYTCQ